MIDDEDESALFSDPGDLPEVEFEMHCLNCQTVSPGADECPVCGSDDLEFHEA